MRYYQAQRVDRHIESLRSGLQDTINKILAETLNTDDPRLESFRTADHLLGALATDLRRYEEVIVPAPPEEETERQDEPE